MFRNLLKIISDDCIVIKIKNKNVYPIFKNGKSSLFQYAKNNDCQILINNDISTLNDITVFVRNPYERFVSGINTVINFESVSNIDKFLNDVENYNFIDKHFIPQFLWLFHLSKYYKSDVTIKGVEDLLEFIPLREKPNVPSVGLLLKSKLDEHRFEKYTDVDYFFINKFKNKTVKLKTIIEEGYDFLSKN